MNADWDGRCMGRVPRWFVAPVRRSGVDTLRTASVRTQVALSWCLAAVLALPAAFSACSALRSADSVATDPSASSLEGWWLLTEFNPELELEPVFAEFLRDELGVLVVELHDGQLSVRGRTVDLKRRYVVLDQVENYLRVGVFDEPGVQTHFQVRRVGDELVFRCQDSPWRGSGTLRMVSAASADDRAGDDAANDDAAERRTHGTRFNAIPGAGGD